MNLSAHLSCLQTPGPTCKASMLRTNYSYVSAGPTSTTLLESRSIPRHSRCYVLISKRKLTPRYLSKRRLSVGATRRAQQSEETRAYGVHLGDEDVAESDLDAIWHAGLR